MGDITASTDGDVDQIIGEVEAEKLNVDKVGRTVRERWMFNLISDLLSDPHWSLLV